MKNSFTLSKNQQYMLSLVLSIVLALLIGALIIRSTGKNPLEAYTSMIKGVFGSKTGSLNTLSRFVTLVLTALAAAIASKAGIFNVGGEGQLYMGALASSIIGFTFLNLPPFIATLLGLLSAIIAGSLFAFIPAILKIKLKINEVITTVMLNSIAIYFCSYLVNGPLKTADKGIASGTNAINTSYRFTKFLPTASLNSSIFYCLVIALIIWYITSQTTLGYELKVTGQNSIFAKYSGLSQNKIMILAMMCSGAICGIVGMFEVFGTHGRFIDNISKEFYFDGMLVAMIMRYEPKGIILMSLFFAGLKVGGLAMENTIGVSSEIVLIIQSIIIFFMAAQNGIFENIKNLINKKNQKA